ncbi:MAG: hypothetical protein ACLP56_03395 [Candidatus Sulfotelmatobacter sp.]
MVATHSSNKRTFHYNALSLRLPRTKVYAECTFANRSVLSRTFQDAAASGTMKTRRGTVDL